MKKVGYVERYDKHIDGVYGKSKTIDSHSLEYLQASMKVEDAVENLKAALDVLEFEKLEFGQLIQRDIDYKRVIENIIGQYLEVGKDKVIFFPPLVVALVEVKNGVPVDKYPNSSTSRVEKYNGYEWSVATKRWGNLFQLVFPIEKEETDWSIEIKQDNGTPQTVYFQNFNAGLDYASRNIKLIVVDGQHRLKALEILYKKNRELLKDMNIPICIFMPSESTDESDQNDTVIKDMRELFVTINTEAQKVSGHFRDLLNDKKLSCECVRALADKWKRESDGKDKTHSRLHLLEWNQRDDKKANQRTVPYSITTVSILVEILDKIFEDMGVALLLDLKARRSELEEKSPYTSIDVIGNESFEPVQLSVIREQIDKLLVPSLDVLLRTPIPYEGIEKVLNKKLEELSKRNDMTGLQSFLLRLFEFRSGHPDYDMVESIEIEDKFKKEIKNEITDEIQYFFTNVFQNGFICFWGDLCKLLMVKYRLTSKDIADILVLGLNKFCFVSKNEVFSYKSSFTQDTIFSGQKIIVNMNSRKACKNLIAIAILEKECVKAIKGKLSIESKDNLIADIEKYSRDAFEEFKNNLCRKRRDKLVKNWEIDDSLEESVKLKLMNSRGDQTKIKEICEDAVLNEVVKNLSQLENKLGMEFTKRVNN